MNTDAISHQSKTPEKYLESDERENKKKYLHTCLNKRRHFTPFVSFVDGLLGIEAAAKLKHIIICPATKWKEPYSHTCGYVKSRWQSLSLA